MEVRRSAGTRGKGRRILHGRQRARKSSRRGDYDSEEEEESSKGLSLHWAWYIIGLSILLVSGLSWEMFLALPEAGAEQRHFSFNLKGLLRRGNAQLAPGMPPPAMPQWPPAGSFLGAEPARPGSGIPPSYAQQAAVQYEDPRFRQPPPAYQPPQPQAFHPPQPQGSDTASLLGSLQSRVHAAAAQPQVASPVQAAPPVAIGVLSGSPAAAGGIGIFDGEVWWELSGAVDSTEITFGAWIYLPKVPNGVFPPSSASMKTIVSTKASGCKVEEGSAGWALFVHEWGTTNRQLRLSWTDASSACHELFSDSVLVPYEAWTLVGFSLSKEQNRATMVINNQLSADTQQNIGKYVIQGKPHALSDVNIASRTLVPGRKKVFLGAHAPQPRDANHAQSHVMVGFIGDARLLHASAFPTPQDMLKALTDRDPPPTSRLFFSVNFKKGSNPEGLQDGTQWQIQRIGGNDPEIFVLRDYVEHPKHPLLEPAATGGYAGPTVTGPPGPTLDPAALKATWPKEWLEKFSEAELLQSQVEADPWADQVRDAMRHTWSGYKKRAWGHDDLKPKGGQPKDWCKMAITMLDALSTLYLMGMHDEFNEAAEWLEQNQLPTPGKHGLHSLFEITIRALGGLLSAYSLSNKKVFLDTAIRLADNLMPAYGAGGLPKSTVDVGTGQAAWHSYTSNAVLAEVATLQVEMRFLSKVSGDPKYGLAADKAMNIILDLGNGRGLIPIYLTHSDTPKFTGSKISLGAMGDSYYEYLLKLWLQSGKKENRFKEVWKTAMKETMEQLVVTTKGGLTFISEKDGGRPRMRMDHLACFVAGMLMMGSQTLPPDEVDPRWKGVAEEVTRTCYEMYRRSPTGLSPEYVVFNTNAQGEADMSIPMDAPHNLLRPEAAEAIYYMWYYTGDPKYRRWAAEMFAAFNKHCKVRYGFSAIADVRQNPVRHRDSQESFWLAETLKYFYLIFTPRSTLNLEEMVLNTEAQPMKMWS